MWVFSFVMTPTVFIPVCLAAALLALVCRRAGTALMLTGSILLYVSAMPAVATSLLRELDDLIPTGLDLHDAQAIVILSADLQPGNGSNEPDTIGPITLKRVAFGARLYRIVHLPVLVSGGHIPGSSATLGALMRDEFEQNFAVPVAWNEERSRTTYENAVFSAQLLKPANVTSVLLVTGPAHMPRALWAFEHVGLHVIPWPTPRTTPEVGHIGAYLPSANALAQTSDALHEILGLVYYRLAYGSVHDDPKPSVQTTNPDKIIASAGRGYQAGHLQKPGRFGRFVIRCAEFAAGVADAGSGRIF